VVRILAQDSSVANGNRSGLSGSWGPWFFVGPAAALDSVFGNPTSLLIGFDSELGELSLTGHFRTNLLETLYEFEQGLGSSQLLL
jgi:hypothetical protein